MGNANRYPAPVQAFRRQYREGLSPSYSGILHLLATSLVCLTAMTLCLWQLHQVTWLEGLTVPVTFLYANFVEYRGHRYTMHRRRRFLSLVFIRHQLQHHRFFTHEAMEGETMRDFKITLFSTILMIFFIGIFALPAAVPLYFLLSPNVAYLFLATSVGYFLNYEGLHLAYHSSKNSWVRRFPFIPALKRHHAAHHNPALMGKVNFNITYPICDWIFGTTYRG